MDAARKTPSEVLLPRESPENWSWLAQHWLAPLAFIPFAVMLLVARMIGLSDALMMASPTFDTSYNLVMGLVFYLGVFSYVTHTVWMATRQSGGWGWAMLKFVLLGTGWATMLILLGGW